MLEKALLADGVMVQLGTKLQRVSYDSGNKQFCVETASGAVIATTLLCATVS